MALAERRKQEESTSPSFATRHQALLGARLLEQYGFCWDEHPGRDTADRTLRAGTAVVEAAHDRKGGTDGDHESPGFANGAVR